MKKIYILLIFLFALSNCYSQKQIRSKSSNPKILVGCWWYPHSATIQIHFSKNGTFVFNDVDNTILKGKYYLNQGTITLSYYDRKPQNFYLKYHIDSEGKPYFEIYKKGYSFVKNIENNDCNW
jgi:hypothetical protein